MIRTSWLHIAVLGILACIFFAWNANTPSFWRGDESVYVLGVQDTARTGALWYPTWISDGQQYPFWMKPPLRLWLGILSVSFLGESNFTHRIPDIIAGFFILLLTFSLAQKLLGSARAAYVAVCALLGSYSFIFLHGPRQVSLDPLLVALQLATLAAGWQIIEAARDSRSRSMLWWAVGGGIACGAAGMTKSIAALIPYGIIFAYLIAAADRAALFRRTWKPALLSLAVAGSIALPYFIFHCTLTFGACFPLVYEDIFVRSTQGYINSSDALLYVRELFVARSLVPPELLIPALIAALFQLRSTQSKKTLFILLWGILPLMVFSYLPSRLLWYAYFSLPALGIMIGNLAETLLFAPSKKNPTALRIFAGLLLAVSLGLPFTQNLIQISTPRERLLLDTFIEEFRQKTPHETFAAVSLGFTHPRNESIYPAMLKERFQRVADLAHLPSKARFIAAHPEQAKELLNQIPVHGYLRLPPAEGRKRWILIFDTAGGELLSNFQNIFRGFDLSAHELPFLFGWSDIGEQEGVRYRRVRGDRAAFELTGDFLFAELGAQLAIAVAGDPHDRITVALDGHVLAADQTVSKGFSTWNLEIPPGLLSAGRHQLLFSRNERTSPLKLSTIELKLRTKNS